MKKYYGFEYYSCKNTTTGEPNLLTKRLSIAGELEVFENSKDLQDWISKGSLTVDMRGTSCRVRLLKSEVRKHHLGMSLVEYQEMLQNF